MTPQASENLAEGCKCGDNDVECWNKCLSTSSITPQASENAKPTEKPASDRKLLTANLDESTLMLELIWSDHATKIVQMKDVGEVEEDCFYSGLFIEDPRR